MHTKRCPIIFNCQFPNHIVWGICKITKLNNIVFLVHSYTKLLTMHRIHKLGRSQLSSHPHRLVESELFYINNLLLIATRGKFNGS